MAVIIPERQPVDTKYVYDLLRLTALGSTMNRIVDEELWPSVVARLRVRDAVTNIDGKYRIADLQGGRYYVYSLFATDHAAVEWMRPIMVDRSEEVSCDLYNETATTIVNKTD